MEPSCYSKQLPSQRFNWDALSASVSSHMIAQLAVSQAAVRDFASRGFVVFSDSAVALETLTALRSELERVLLGKSGGPYDSQALPTKVSAEGPIAATHALTCRRCPADLKSMLCFKPPPHRNLRKLFK
jgi:hypothetical protein